MHSIPQTEGWAKIAGLAGISARLLSGDFNEPAATGFRTRIVRFDQGAGTAEAFSHSYWEEVTLIEGSLLDRSSGTLYHAPCYVLRPPGTPHGPYLSEAGCLMLESQYFATREVGEAAFLDQKAP